MKNCIFALLKLVNPRWFSEILREISQFHGVSKDSHFDRTLPEEKPGESAFIWAIAFDQMEYFILLQKREKIKITLGKPLSEMWSMYIRVFLYAKVLNWGLASQGQMLKSVFFMTFAIKGGSSAIKVFSPNFFVI